MLSDWKSKASKLRVFLTHDLWITDLQKLPFSRRASYRFLRVGQIVGRDFVADQCPLKASALTYITLMSLVPMLAMAFSVAKGMGAQKWLMEAMDATLVGLPHQISDFIRNVFLLVERTDFLALGAIGSVFLIYTVIKVMGRIEEAFNYIWGVHEPRTFVRKFADYISVVLIVPVIIIVAFTLNATLSSEKMTVWMADRFGPIAAVYELTLRFSGTLGVVVAFTLLYMFLPNTKVKWTAAITGGIVAGLSWIIWQWVCIRFQIVITRFNTIYGAFATLPISLFWLQVNWMITLLGAEICFAAQNHRTYLMESQSESMSFTSKRLLAFLLVYDICRAFRRGERWTAQAYQEQWNVPIRLIQDVLHSLEQGQVVLQTAEKGYVPARDTSLLTLDMVEEALAGEPDGHTQQLARRLGKQVFNQIGSRYDTHHDALAKDSFADLLNRQDEASEE